MSAPLSFQKGRRISTSLSMWSSPSARSPNGASPSALWPSSAAAVPGGRDRKSTRLNSSHVKRSYAVFCLKKTKKDRNRHEEALHQHAAYRQACRPMSLCVHLTVFARWRFYAQAAQPFGAFPFFFNDTATTEIYTLSLHDALPIYQSTGRHHRQSRQQRAARVFRSVVCL